MTNPYLPPEESQKRVFKTPLIVPLSVVLVLAIYAGYVFFYNTSDGTGFLDFLKAISFQVFLLCEIGMVSLILYNKNLLDKFLREFPTIQNRQGLEALKPIIRTNMYSSLFMFLFLALGSLTSIMTIITYGGIIGISVAVLSVATAILINWYNRSEKKTKHIECTDNTLEPELNKILQCWIHKPFPSF